MAGWWRWSTEPARSKASRSIPPRSIPPTPAPGRAGEDFWRNQNPGHYLTINDSRSAESTGRRAGQAPRNRREDCPATGLLHPARTAAIRRRPINGDRRSGGESAPVQQLLLPHRRRDLSLLPGPAPRRAGGLRGGNDGRSDGRRANARVSRPVPRPAWGSLSAGGNRTRATQDQRAALEASPRHGGGSDRG